MYLDARGLRCPMPLLKLKQALHGLAVDDILTVRQTKHQLLLSEQRGDEFYYEIKKGS